MFISNVLSLFKEFWMFCNKAAVERTQGFFSKVSTDFVPQTKMHENVDVIFHIV